MTIEVDERVAEILRRVEAQAKANGETLGRYLERNLLRDVERKFSPEEQAAAWKVFVEEGQALSAETLPAGACVDDSRESMYRDEW